MALTFQNTKTQQRARERFFFIGDMSSGKTLAASTFDAPVWIQPVGEDSIDTLTKRGMEIPVLFVGGPADKARNTSGSVLKDINNILNELLAQQKIDPNGLPGETLVWDGLSHLGDMIVSEIAAGNPKNPGEMDMRLWGDVREVWVRIQQICWQLDMHIVFIAHPHVETAQGTGQVISAGPRIQGSAKQSLPAQCGHIGIFDVLLGDGVKKPDIYRAFFKKYNSFPGRTRSPNFPKEVQNFNFQELKKFL